MNLRSLLAVLTLPFAAFAADLIEFIENPAGNSPARTIELRFAEDMIAPDQIGEGDAPMALTPEHPGKWTWQSTRSGVFVPAAAWPLGTTFQISPRDGTKTVAGKALPADWRRTLDMPPFGPQAWTALSYRSDDDQAALPRYAVLFNADVSAADAAASFRFIHRGHEDMPALVTAPDAKNPGTTWFRHWVGVDRPLLTWSERFQTNEMPPGPRKNQLFVTPAKPLPPGVGWRLVMKAGLPAAGQPMLRTLADVDFRVGEVKPFELGSIEATNYLNQGKRLHVRFNKPLREGLDLAALSRWISITPTPSKLAVKVEYREVEFTGDFALGTEYRVAVEPGVPADEPFVLASGKIENVSFEPVPSRLYFEAYETHQMRGGARKFHLLAVNIPKVRVVAKLFTGTAIPVALRGYDDYYDSPKDQPDESHTKIDFTKLPGQVVWQQEIAGTDETDEQREVALDWTQILGANRSGVVLLTAEAVAPAEGETLRPGAQAMVQLTDLGAVWKRAPGETFVHVFSMQSGKGVGGAQVKLLSEKDKVVAKAKADEHGIARLPAADDARWIVVENGSDTHLIEFRNGRNYIDLARVDVDYSEDEETASDSVRAFLFTERGVYRPSETVHLKGILRDWRPGQKALASGLKVRLSVKDAREREFLTKPITLSALGSFAEDIALPEGVLGFYTIALHLPNPDGETEVATHEFQVEEFKPNAFEIVIGEAPKTPGPLEIALPVTAKYYMGKTLSKAQLTWSVDAHDESFEPEGFDDFSFADAIQDYRLEEHLDRRSSVSEQGKAQLDAQGATAVAVKVPLNAKAPQPRKVRVSCEVTDVNQQTVTSAHTFTQHSSDFYLGFRQFRALLHEGEAIPLEVVAIRTDNTPTPEPVEVEATLTRIDWETNRVQTDDNATELRNAPKFVLAARRTFKTAAVTKHEDRWQVGATALAEPLMVEKPGHYLLELTTRDPAGRSVLTSTSFQVYGAGATAWDYRNPFQVELVPEKDDYTAGETAKILVKTPISGDALVTVEREKVLRSFVTRLEGNAPVIEVPMLPGDAPNVFVSVLLLRGANDSPRKIKAPEYRIGYCEVNVVNPAAQLTVYVKPERKSYQPGEQVGVSAEVLDWQGKPVRDAEVTLYAVDEGVLSLTGYETPDPLTFFNEPRGLTVSTALTLPALLNEDPEERDFGNKGYLVGGGGEDLNNVRKNFLACAFWNATLRTDAAGRALASFTAPDSLTRYRVMAVVQTVRDQFGSADGAFEVNKPVMLEPALPRFANVGDQLSLRAVLHNTTDLAGEAEVRVVFDGTVKLAETIKTIQLAAKETAALDFPVEFLETGTATWQWSVRFASGEVVHRDVVRTTLKVRYPAPLLRHVETRRIEGDIPNLLAGVDPQLLEGKGSVRVSFTNSRAIELQEALDQLLHYPYGCVEQTTSSTLPWLTLNRLRGVLPSLQRGDDEIIASIRRGVTRLLSMQTGSGGLGYWPGDQRPMLWGSAYGSLALTLAKQQGHAVPADEYENLMKWMSTELRGTAEIKDTWQLRERCLVVFALALAGRSEPAYHTLLFDKRDLLGTEDRALLALAILESKGQPAMVDALLGEAKVVSDEAWFWSPSRTLALQLLCWSRHQAKSPRVEALAKELFNARRDGHWWTTQGNAWAVFAMSDYLTRTERGGRAASGRLTWGGTNLNFALGAKAEVKTQTYPVSEANARVPLALAGVKASQLFSEVRVESYPPLRDQPAQDRGYQLGRRYAKIEDDGSLAEAKDLRVGDRVLVTLTLDVRRRATYVAIEDPLPAVFEPVNPNFKTQQAAAAEGLGVDFVSDFRELREDRALFFADTLVPGRYTLRYLARVVAAGTATAPCAKVEEMYHPERHGLTASEKIISAALK